MKKKGKELIFISRINSDGSGVEVVENIWKYLQEEEFDLTCLSMSKGTYIASRMNSFIVKLKPENHKRKIMKKNMDYIHISAEDKTWDRLMPIIQAIMQIDIFDLTDKLGRKRNDIRSQLYHNVKEGIDLIFNITEEFIKDYQKEYHEPKPNLLDMREEVFKAWAEIRKTNSTIPDDVLDFMKDSSIQRLKQIKKLDR